MFQRVMKTNQIINIIMLTTNMFYVYNTAVYLLVDMLDILIKTDIMENNYHDNNKKEA